MLEAFGLAHSFDYLLFEDIKFSLQSSQSIAIIGVSGSGKSTLLHILSSLLKPNSGDVFFKQKNLYNLKEEQLLKIRREDFGIIFQSHYLFRGFSGYENLLVSELLSEQPFDDELLKRLKIDDVLSQNIGELSGGQQQRLSIARVLIKKPKIIFADEPTGNLDQETALDVVDELIEYVSKEKAGMIMVTHNLDLAQKCDKIYKLQNKGLVQIK